MQPNEVLQLIGLVKARYQAKFQHTPSVEQMWNMVLDDVPLEPCKTILADWFKTEDWPPDPAYIRNKVLDTTSGLPTPEEAWQMVQQRIKNTYPGMPAEAWDAPGQVQAAAKDIGGIYLIRQAEKPDAMRQRYEDAYRRRRDSIRSLQVATAVDAPRKQLKELT